MHIYFACLHGHFQCALTDRPGDLYLCNNSTTDQCIGRSLPFLSGSFSGFITRNTSQSQNQSKYKTFNFDASWQPTNILNLTPEQVHLIDIPNNPTLAQDLHHLPAQFSVGLKSSSHPLPHAIYGLVLTSVHPPHSVFSPSSSPAQVPPLPLHTLYDAHPNYCIGAIVELKQATPHQDEFSSKVGWQSKFQESHQ